MLISSTTSSIDLQAKLFRGFADPSRLFIIEALRESERTVSDLVRTTGFTQPDVPNHLSCLRDCGLVSVRQQGRFSYYSYRANLLPENKIDVVKEYQAKGHVVVMIGDGVNDAPALAQANVGIVMAAAGTDVAIEAAHIALMREDWNLVTDVLKIAKRTMKIVKMNLAFTTVYNLVGLSPAAVGILPPVLAAAAQSLPDIGLMGNSARLLKQK